MRGFELRVRLRMRVSRIRGFGVRAAWFASSRPSPTSPGTVPKA